MDSRTPQVEYLHYAWLVVRKRRRLITVVALSTLAAVMFFSYLVTPVWEASALVHVERTSKQNLSLFRDVNLPVPEAAASSDTALGLIPLLTGTSMAYDVVTTFGLDELSREKRLEPSTARDVIKNLMVDIVYGPLWLWRGWQEPNWTDKAAEEFAEDWIDVEEEEQRTGVIRITVFGESPQQATEIANGMIELLETRTLELSRGQAGSAYDFVSQELGEAEENVKSAEAEVEEFQRDAGLYAPDETRRLLVEQVNGLEMELLATTRLVGQVQTSLRGLARGEQDQPASTFVQANISLSPVIIDLQTRLVELHARRSALLVEHTEAYPDVLVLEAEIERNLEQLRDALEVELANLVAREKELRQSVEEVERRLATMPEKEMELARLQQAVEVRRSILGALRTRQAQLAIERESVANEYGIRVLDRAYLPPGTDADWPIWGLNLVMGLMLALTFGLGGAFVAEYWNEPIRTERDVRQLLGVPLLGRFPDLTDEDS